MDTEQPDVRQAIKNFEAAMADSPSFGPHSLAAVVATTPPPNEPPVGERVSKAIESFVATEQDTRTRITEFEHERDALIDELRALLGTQSPVFALAPRCPDEAMLAVGAEMVAKHRRVSPTGPCPIRSVYVAMIECAVSKQQAWAKGG